MTTAQRSGTIPQAFLQPRAPKKLPPILLALYTRISEADDDDGVQRQETRLRKRHLDHMWVQIAIAHGREVILVGVYSDNDISAADVFAVRPDFERLIRDIEAGKVNTVMAWDFDRLWRDNYDFNRLLRAMRLAGGQAMLAFEGDPRLVDIITGEGIDMAQIKGAMSDASVRSTKSRIRFKHEHLAENGMFGGGSRRFGYQIVDKNLVIDPEEAQHIREAIPRLLARKISLTALAREWNERGIKTAKAGKWNAQTLKKLLAEPPSPDDPEAIRAARLLMSERGFNVKQIVIHLNQLEIAAPQTMWTAANLRRVFLGEHIAGIRTSETGAVRVQAKWEPIIDIETHVRLVELLTDPSRKTNPGSTEAKYLFTGMFRCGACRKGTLYVRENYGERTWGCLKTLGGCNGLGRKWNPTEEWVTLDVLAMFRREEFVRGLIQKQAAAQEVDLSGLMEELEQRRTLLHDLENDYYNPRPGRRRPSDAIYDRLSREHEGEIERLERALREAADQKTEGFDVELLTSGAAWRSWDRIPLAKQRVLLKAAVRYVILKPVGRGGKVTREHYEIVWAA